MPRPARPAHRPLSLSGSHWRADGRPKVRYASRQEAVLAAADRAEAAGTELGVYSCDFCHGWHMGRPSSRDG